MKSQCSDLFIVMQPLQYLQALELKNSDRFNTLILLGANEKNQLNRLVKERDWDRIVWLSYNGTFIDIIKHQKSIKVLLTSFTHLNEIVVSSYYNEFMNMVINYFPKKSRVLLEDGVANLLIDSSTRYVSIKFQFKLYLCKLFGYNVSPINAAKVFTVFKSDSGKIPKIASEVIVNKYSNIRNKIDKYEQNKDVFFVSSDFVKCGMISIKNYMLFLTKLSQEYPSNTFNIILHRFDDLRDFASLKCINNVNVINSVGPIELYFIENKVNPYKVITAGSGATETLKLIYDIDIDVVMPKLSKFTLSYQKEMELLALHFEASHSVKFI